MTTIISVPDHVFPVHVPLFDIPQLSNNRVFSVFGGTLAESLANHSGRAAGAAVGTINLEPMGIRQFGTDDYIRFTDIGTLSPAGFTMIIAFRTLQDVAEFTSGLVNLWSQTDKNSDTLRRRIFTDGSAGSGPIRTYSFPPPSGPGTNWQGTHDSPYLVSMVRAGNGATSNLRMHNADGTSITGNTIAVQATPMLYSVGTVLEVGNGSTAGSGGSLIQGVALWDGTMDAANIAVAAASLASASGVFL
jgi:hypothetical protein